MKKIIAAIDGLKYSQDTIDYAIQFAMDSDAHLVGVFLDDITHHSYKIYEVIHSEGGVSEEKMERFEKQDKDLRIETSDPKKHFIDWAQTLAVVGLAGTVLIATWVPQIP